MKIIRDNSSILRRGIWILVLGLFASSCLSTESQVDLSVQTNLMRVQNNDVALHVEVAGRMNSESALVAIHGGPGNSSDYMVSLKRLAGPDLSVILYDQRGTGLSSVPTSGYAIGQYVGDLEAVRKAINAERIHVFGHSWGGIVAMCYAIVHPENVRSLILMGSGPPNIRAFAAAQAHAAERVTALQGQGVIPEQITTISDLLPAYFSNPDFEMPGELANMSYDTVVQSYTMKELGEYDITDDVSKIKVPVLVLWGEDDLFGISMMNATVEALRDAEVKTVILRSCGHYWHECPAEFFRQIEAFLADN